MNLNIPLESGGVTKNTGQAATHTLANNAAQLQAKVALARLPQHVMQLKPQTAGISDTFNVKVPTSFSFDDKAQHQLARTTSSANAKPVLVEHTMSTQRAVISPEQANKIAEAVSRTIPANASIPTNSIQATVVHAPGSQLSLKLAIPGNPIVNIALNQTVSLSQGDKIQLTLTQNTPNELQVSINSAKSNNALIADIKLSPNHILAQQFTKQQMASGISISPQILLRALEKAGVSSIKVGATPLVTLAVQNNQLSVTTTKSQPIAQLTLSKAVTNLLPVLSAHENVKSLPLLTPIESVYSKDTATSTTNTQPAIAQRLDSINKTQVQDAIMQLSRRLLNETGSTREALSQLITSLNSPSTNTSANTATLMRNLAQQFTQGLVAEESGSLKITPNTTASESSKPPSVQALQALFTSPSLPITSQALTSPVSQSSFVSGLVAILQMTFAGRAIRNQPHLGAFADDAGSFIHKSMANLGVSGAASKTSQEFSRLDGQRQMLENIKTLLANHRQHKLANVDHRLQGQDSFYYVLPVNSQHQSPPEVLLKREEQNAKDNDASASASKVWNFTMKLDIDELGKLLVKSKVSSSALNLNLYTSSDALLAKVQETLPILLKRLSALGLTIEHSSCQRGKIPETLSDNPYQLFETHA